MKSLTVSAVKVKERNAPALSNAAVTLVGGKGKEGPVKAKL